MKFAPQLKNDLHLVIAFSILILMAALSSFTSKNSGASPLPENERIEMDTIIPKGYVLVPLELENLAAISAVIQNYGVIDLYKGNPDGSHALRIAHRIKLIRAPYNPNLFAALVKEDLSERIMKQSGAFFAVIQNKTEGEGDNQLNSPRVQKNIVIDYQK